MLLNREIERHLGAKQCPQKTKKAVLSKDNADMDDLSILRRKRLATFFRMNRIDKLIADFNAQSV